MQFIQLFIIGGLFHFAFQQINISHQQFICASDNCCIKKDGINNSSSSLKILFQSSCMNGYSQSSTDEPSGYYLPKICNIPCMNYNRLSVFIGESFQQMEKLQCMAAIKHFRDRQYPVIIHNFGCCLTEHSYDFNFVLDSQNTHERIRLGKYQTIGSQCKHNWVVNECIGIVDQDRINNEDEINGIEEKKRLAYEKKQQELLEIAKKKVVEEEEKIKKEEEDNDEDSNNEETTNRLKQRRKRQQNQQVY